MAALRTIVVGLMMTLVLATPIVNAESAVELDAIIHLSEDDLGIKGIAENPEKDKILKEDLENLSKLNSSIVFFISPKKINKNIPLIKKNFIGRKILICREMTKFYVEVSGINKVITVSSQHFDNQSFENNTCFISISLEDISLLQKK